MRTVHKFPLQFDHNGEALVVMPFGAHVLDIQAQKQVNGESLMIWALVATDLPNVNYYYHKYGTGWTIEENVKLEHVKTVQDGEYVWHIFQNYGVQNG